MFFKGLRQVEERLESLRFAIKEVYREQEKLVECETCGCAIKKDTAVKGESIIKKHELMFFAMQSCFKEENCEEYIHQVYYCKRCAPKDKTKNKEEK